MKALDEAIKKLRATFDGDSNDAEHDAAVDLLYLIDGKRFALPAQVTQSAVVRLVPTICAFIKVPRKLRYDFDAILAASGYEGGRLLQGDGVAVDDLDTFVDMIDDEGELLAFFEKVKKLVEADSYLFE